MEKSIFKNFSRYVSLNILGMVSISCYILTDTYFISKALGHQGLAALDLSTPMYSFIYAVALMLAIGGSTRYSILKAKKDTIRANRVYSICINVGLITGILFAMIGIFFSNSLGVLLGADIEILPMTEIYLRTILCFSPFFILNDIILSFVRNDNNPNLPMIAILLGSFFNIVLDYIFIFYFDMGMFGAAFATGLAPIISLVVLASYFIRAKNHFKYIPFKFNWSYLKDISTLGLSAFVNEISAAIVIITFNLVILNLEGNYGLASYAIIANIDLVVFAVFNGLAEGIQPIISKSHGLNDDFVLKKTLKYALLTSLGLALLIYFALNFNAESIIRAFNEEENIKIAIIGKAGLKIYFIGYFFAGINITLTMFLTATEKARLAFLLSVLRGCIVIVPMVLVLSCLWKMTGVWLSFVLAELFVTVIAIFIMGVKSRQIIKLKFENNS